MRIDNTRHAHKPNYQPFTFTIKYNPRHNTYIVCYFVGEEKSVNVFTECRTYISVAETFSENSNKFRDVYLTTEQLEIPTKGD